MKIPHNHPMPPIFQNFAEFWPYYLSEHSQPMTRRLHFVGTALALVSIGLGWIYGWEWFVTAPVLAYGCAWFSHFFIEKNLPATFRHPLWSLRADFKLFYKMLIRAPII